MSSGHERLRRVLSEVAVPSPKPVLVLDFDGTVSLGDGPVLAYAEEAFAKLPADRRTAAEGLLRRYLAGDRELVHRYADGYGCVRGQIVDQLTPEELSAAFLASRRRLATDDLGTYPAPGVADLLITIGSAATRVLLTNSPAVGVLESLQRFGLADLFDQVVVGAAKQLRMTEHVDILTEGRAPATLISVGDHWRNDLAVPLQRGCATAYVTGQDANSHPAADEPAHVSGRDVGELAPAITAWAANPVEFLAAHRPTPEPDPVLR